MLIRKISILVLLAAAISVSACGGRHILSYNDVPINIENSSENKIKKAILLAGARRGWNMKSKKDGLIIATYRRGKIMAKLKVNYSKESYSINYLDSENLKYNGETIHRRYNGYVKRLKKTIDKELLVLMVDEK